MTAALLIPHDDAQALRVVDATDDTLAALIGAEYFELVTDVRGGFSIVVDDSGLITGKPSNLRATHLAQTFGRAHQVPLVGDALVIGIDPGGETVDAPASLLRSA